jgi:hypothetical protein
MNRSTLCGFLVPTNAKIVVAYEAVTGQDVWEQNPTSREWASTHQESALGPCVGQRIENDSEP